MKAITSKSALENLAADAGMLRIEPAGALLAESEEDVSSATSIAAKCRLSLTPRGGGTSIPTQSVGKGIILLQDRRAVANAGEGLVSCEPALVKAELNQTLAKRGVWMPVDPSSYESCTLGGMVANNSSGIRTLKYGSTIDYVKGLRAVLANSTRMEVGPGKTPDIDGRFRRIEELVRDNWDDIVEEVPNVSKNSSGYRLERCLADGAFDPSKLLVGSEGTLAVFTGVTFRVIPKPSWKVLLIVESRLDELNERVEAFSELSPSALELVDKSVFRLAGKEEKVLRYSRSEDEYMLFCELDGEGSESESRLEEVASSRVADMEPLVVTDPEEISAAWGVRNETLRLGLEIRRGRRVLLPGVEDLVVPKGKLAGLVKILREAFEDRGLTYISYGHAGDANLHARPLLDPEDPSDRKVLGDLMDECFEKVWRMKGSMSGEHGDGVLRAAYLDRQYPKTHWVMKEVRAILDPKGLLNPGVKVV